MNIDLIKLKALATAAAANQYDAVALNDYGMAVPPATVLGLIAEIERHRQVNAEGCKPDSNILLSGVPCAGAAPRRSLDEAEGCKPDLNSPQATAAEVETPDRPITPTLSQLSYRMQDSLKHLHKRPNDYYGSCTNPTMNALKKRGLVDIEWSQVPGSIYRREKWVITTAGVAALGRRA